MLANFTLSHLRFTLVPRQRIGLPRMNKGITLRGGFGAAFRSLVCIDRSMTCDSCGIHTSCPYGLVFSPTVPEEAQRLRLNRDIPRPFVIKPPLGPREVYEPGEPFCFELVLVGKARDFFPYFFLCFQKLGEMGIGAGRGRFRVHRVESLNTAKEPFLVYEEGNPLVNVSESPITFSELAARAPGDRPSPAVLRVRFLTPVLLKDAGKWAPPHFGPLLRRLRDRIHALSYFYCGETLDMDFSGFGAKADEVTSTPERIAWVEEKRCSRHRGIEYPLQGYHGSMIYEGDLRPFLPFLSLGEYVHVGKAATFGQGWYEIRD